ncbi:uncharacterized protein [Diadema antillarum]|uniref:uncharacterized protein n=1 Tax=Diadema antillarum TaxID=105358 RepID=UPI003A88B961
MVSDMAEDEEVNWLDCVSAIVTSKGVIYFCDEEYFSQKRWSSCPEEKLAIATIEEDVPSNGAPHAKKKRSNTDDMLLVQESQAPANLAKSPSRNENKPLLTPIANFSARFDHGRFMYSITAYNPLDTRQDNVQNCLCNQLLLSDLRAAFPDGEILNNFSYFPHRPQHFERGFTVILPLTYPKDHEGIVHRLALKYRQAAYFKCRILPGGRNTQTIVFLQGCVREVQENLLVVERLSYHPAYLDRSNNSVFHRFYDAMDILSKCDYLPEARQMMGIVKQQVSFDTEITRSQRQPVLVLEGTYDAGVSAYSQHLSRAIGAVHRQSPPSCIRHLKEAFDSQNQLVRGAFYTLGNYILAAQVANLSKKAPVVLDRFWNSTAAFTITSEVGRGVANLPPRNHFVYTWPKDLMQPDAVILVGSAKSSRLKCASSPAVKVEKEERISKRLMLKTLHRMKDSTWIEVDRIRDNCHSPEAVTMTIMDNLHEKGVVSFHSRADETAGLCPSTKLHPILEHDILPVGSEYQPDRAGVEDLKMWLEGDENDADDQKIGFL